MAELDNILGDILNYEDYSTGVSPETVINSV